MEFNEVKRILKNIERFNEVQTHVNIRNNLYTLNSNLSNTRNVVASSAKIRQSTIDKKHFYDK